MQNVFTLLYVLSFNKLYCKSIHWPIAVEFCEDVALLWFSGWGTSSLYHAPFDSVSPSSSPLFPTPWGVYPLSIVYVKKMIIIYRIWDQKFHLPFPCPLLYVYVSKLQMTQTFPQAIIRHKNVQQMLCVCLGRTQCLIIGNFCLIKIANIIHMQYNLTLE